MSSSVNFTFQRASSSSSPPFPLPVAASHASAWPSNASTSSSSSLVVLIIFGFCDLLCYLSYILVMYCRFLWVGASLPMFVVVSLLGFETSLGVFRGSCPFPCLLQYALPNRLNCGQISWYLCQEFIGHIIHLMHFFLASSVVLWLFKPFVIVVYSSFCLLKKS